MNRSFIIRLNKHWSLHLSVCLQLRAGFIWHVLKTHMNETNYNASSQFPCQQGWFLYGFCKAFYAAVLYPGSQMNDLSCLVFYLKCNGITNLNQKNNSQINNLKLHKSHLQFPIKGSHVNPKTCQVPIRGINGFKWIILLVSQTKRPGIWMNLPEQCVSHVKLF